MHINIIIIIILFDERNLFPNRYTGNQFIGYRHTVYADT